MGNVNITNSFCNDIAAGKIPGREFWFKFGECQIDTSLTSLWAGASTLQPGLYQYPTVAAKHELFAGALDVGKVVSVSGLNENWKKQSEEVTLVNGAVQTTYEYLRHYRQSVILGDSLIGAVQLRDIGGLGNVYGYIEDGGFQINQSQAGVYPVPAGHRLFVDRISISKSDIQPIKIYASVRDIGMFGTNTPFRVQLNYNLADAGLFVDETGIPFALTEKIDLEIRGISTGNKTSDVAVNLFGCLERVSSVPIDVKNYSVVAGSGQAVLTWDDYTPADKQDQESFKIEYFDTSNPGLVKSFTVARDEIGVTVHGLTTGVEYQINAYFVGYDNKLSNAVSQTVTIL